MFLFEKKNEKTSAHSRSTEFKQVNSVLRETDKSFLLLFFKKEVLYLLSSAALVFACTWMGQSGAAVTFRAIAVPVALIAAVLLFAPRLRGAANALSEAAPALPALIGFLLLVGIGGVVNHGALFAAMSHDFWHADILVAPDRRPVLPAIAFLLPPWPAPYVVLWYACFIALFLLAWGFLAARGFTTLERFALLTGSIVAYLLIIPGYTEVLTFLVALLCWRADLTAAEKCVAAAVMIGGHEFAALFCLAFLAIEAQGRDRRDWIGVGVFLFAVYAAGYLASAGSALAHAVNAAARPASLHPQAAWELDGLHPWRLALGIAAAYKLLWLLLPSGFFVGGRTRLHAVCVMLALPLVLVAVDTSRIVQFASLSMFCVAAGVWPRLAPAARWALTLGTLLLPSLCEGTIAMPAWGKGLYAVYLLGGEVMGVTLGGMAF
jgi:hypothetical protein